MDFSSLKQTPTAPKKGRWLLIGSIVAVLGVVGVILWQRRKDKKAQEEEAKKLAEASNTATDTNPKSAPVVTTKPVTPSVPVTATTKTPLEQVADNLGSSAKLYTDKVVADITMPDKTKASSVFSGKGGYFVIGAGAKTLASGKWKNGGLEIVLSDGRIIRSSSVWGNIRKSVGA
jgi:hypothetical protein